MVCTTVMEWLRTALTIFRQAVWVETCCYAPKVWYFQSRARSASYCLTVNSFEIFFLSISTFCPTVAEDSNTMNDFKVSRTFKDGSALFLFPSLIISSPLMSPSPNCSLSHPIPQQNAGLSCRLAGHDCSDRDCCSHWGRVFCSHLMGSLLYRCFPPIGCDPGEEQSWLPLHSGQSCKYNGARSPGRKWDLLCSACEGT